MNGYGYRGENTQRINRYALNEFEGRAKMAKASVWVVTSVYVLLNVVALFMGSDPSADPTPIQEIAAWGTLLVFFGLVPALITSCVMWMRWASALHTNLSKVFGIYPESTRTVAVWSYIIPFANLYAPYQFIKEAWFKTAPAERSSNISDVKAWWGLWIGHHVFSQIQVRVFPDVVDGLTFVVLTVVDVAIFVGACVFAVRVVEALTSFQFSLADERERAATPPPGQHDHYGPTGTRAPDHVGW